MEVAEALLTLGVAGASECQTLSAEALKRAYLKKVRVHPPERDPQGFQRVREAYELLRAFEVTSAGVRGSAHFVPGATSSTESEAPAPERKTEKNERSATAKEPDPDSSAFERLQQALTAQQYEAAANALIEIYGAATLTSRRPTPHVVLSLVTRQFIVGAQDLGRRLFLAFETDMALINSPLNARLAASWKLLAELVLLSGQAPPAVIRALASAIQSGDFEEATETLRTELDGRGVHTRVELESSLQAAAPILFKAAWPANRGVSPKQQRHNETWGRRVLFLMVVLVSSFMYIVETSSPRRASKPHAAAASPSNLGALSAEQAKELDSVTKKVEKVVRFSRCNQMRAVWKDYTSVVRRLKGRELVMQGYEKLRVNAGTTCPQVSSELPESP